MPRSEAAKARRSNDLSALAADIEKSFGRGSAARGGLQKALKSIPTGSLALDYELGTGGWPLGYLVGVFGPRDIGKSSMVGFNAIRNAQALDMNCAIIAMEPVAAWDENGELSNWGQWATKNGVNVEELLITYPENGEQAFAILHKILRSGAVDLVIFDSIGSIVSESEAAEDGKARQGGQAGLITWGVKVAAPLAFKNDVCVILLNQVRDNMKSRIAGVVQQPGGHALEHHESIIVQLKRGQGKYTVKQSGTDVQIGGEIVAHILRNKMAEGTGKKAIFDYFFAETDDYPFGIDGFGDVINTAKRTGVIKQAGAYYELPNGVRHQGQKKVVEYLEDNPDVLDMVREGVLAKMLERNDKTVLEAVPEEASA